MRQQNSYPYKIFLGGVKSSFTSAVLLTYFKLNYPSVFKADLPTKKGKDGTTRSRGYALLSLSSQKEYSDILKQRLFNLEGRQMNAKPFLKGSKLKGSKKAELERRVFLPELSREISLKKLRDEMERNFGPVQDLYRTKNPMTKLAKTSAFCFFEKASSTRSAVTAGCIRLQSSIQGCEGALVPIEEFKRPKRVNNEDRVTSKGQRTLKVDDDSDVGSGKATERFSQASNPLLNEERTAVNRLNARDPNLRLNLAESVNCRVNFLLWLKFGAYRC